MFLPPDWIAPHFTKINCLGGPVCRDSWWRLNAAFRPCQWEVSPYEWWNYFMWIWLRYFLFLPFFFPLWEDVLEFTLYTVLPLERLSSLTRRGGRHQGVAPSRSQFAPTRPRNPHRGARGAVMLWLIHKLSVDKQVKQMKPLYKPDTH